MPGVEKPTVFFSHSTKDREMVLAIKEKLDEITGGTLHIFMSSDGQSIPFGSNWEHKIEEGLNDAKIMFVFVTPNSIASNWIYFESGFAYGKKVSVVPVGIGVDVATLKAPLNLLQGFNIISEDGLNNFVTVVNREFGWKFKEGFSEAEFKRVAGLADAETGIGRLELYEWYKQASGEIGANDDDKKWIDRAEVLASWKVFLDQRGIPYSYMSTPKKNTIDSRSEETKVTGEIIQMLVCGIGMRWSHSLNKYRDTADMSVAVALNAPIESFRLYGELMSMIPNRRRTLLRFSLKGSYKLVKKDEQLSAILSKYPDQFMPDAEEVGLFHYLPQPIAIYIDNRSAQDYSLGVIYDPDEVRAEDLCEMLYDLVEKKVVRLK